MKKILTVLFALLLLPIAYAQETVIEPSAGITPDSVLYSLDVWWDNQQVKAEKDTEKRIEKKIKIADERAAEYKVMKEKNNDAAAEKALANHNKEMQEIEAEQSGLSEEKRAHVQAMVAKHLAVLERVKAKILEKKGESPKGLDNAISNAQDLQVKIQTKQSAGIANPASTYCEEQGGEIEIREEADGQVGYCIINDQEYEEWAFYNIGNY